MKTNIYILVSTVFILISIISLKKDLSDIKTEMKYKAEIVQRILECK